MKNEYFDQITKLLEETHLKLFITHRLEFKNVFGAVAGYADGHIFITCGKFGVALKLPSNTLMELFKEKDVLQLRYFPKGHIKREYAVIPQRLVDNKERFKALLDESIRYSLVN